MHTSFLGYKRIEQYYFNNQGYEKSNLFYRCYGNESRLSHCSSSFSSTCQRNYNGHYFTSIILHCGGDIGKYTKLLQQVCRIY